MEGPCFAGKTSTIEGLSGRFAANDFAICPDYADLMSAEAPAPPHATVKKELDAVAYFTKLDQRRLLAAQGAEPHKVIAFDRCYHTLLAHVYACQVLFGTEAWESARAYVTRFRPYVATVTFLLQVSGSELARRSSTSRHNTNPLFTDGDYIGAFYGYFDDGYIDKPTTLVTIDGNRKQQAIVDEILAHTDAALGSSGR